MTLSYIIAALYVYLIFYLYHGWRKLREPGKSDSPTEKIKVSVVVPARNEAPRIGKLLDNISTQRYPEPWLEVIVVDDASDDTTADVVRQWQERHTLDVKLVQLEESADNRSPKKRALSEGIRRATATLVVTTDADCRLNERWIEALVNHHIATGAKMISGPVRLSPVNGFFQKIQGLEFLSLVGAGAGAIGNANPLMCNGANLAFEKEAFDEVGGYRGNENYASGDDVFLMHKMKEHFANGAISFLRDRNAIVDTPAKPNWKAFINQRTRWASKTKAYKDFFSLFAAGVVFMFCIILIIALLMAVAGKITAGHAIALWMVKLLIDLLFLSEIAVFTQQKNLLKWFLPAQLFVVGYTTIAGFLGSLGGFRWKGRTYNLS